MSLARCTRCFAVAAAVALAGLVVPTATGAIVTFTDRTAWAVAAGANGTIETEGFEALPTGALTVGDNQLGLVRLNIQLLGTTTTTSASITSSSPITGTRELNLNADEGFRKYTVTFAGNIFSFGFDYTGAATGGIATLLAGGQTFTFGNLTTSGNGFFGIVSDVPLSEVGFGDTSPGALPTEIFDSDNYSFVLVPEPTTAAALVLTAAATLRRRRTA